MKVRIGIGLARTTDPAAFAGVVDHLEASGVEELVARRHREELLRMDWSCLTPEAVDKMRQPR
jgi:hypothetical protein